MGRVHRYFVYLAYNGARYHGWQVQPNGITVQECLEKSLALLLRRKTPVTGAGRTDTGVHARLMVAHLDTGEPLAAPEEFSSRLDRMLPPDITIYKIVPVRPDAHARFDAVDRTYRYYVAGRKDPFGGQFAWKCHGLDFARMNEAAECLKKYTDFTSFSKLHTDVKTNNCRIIHASWEPEGKKQVFTIKADRFLRNMVRAIVGTLVEVGRGKLTPEDFCRIIESKDRGKAGTSAPANALFLTDITYPEEIFLSSDNRS